MRHLSGQALRRLHRLLHWAEFLLVLAGLGLCGAAWRLSRGPWEIPGMAGRIAAALAGALPAARHLTVHINSAALAWEGFHHTGAPLDIRITGLTVTGRGGSKVVSIPLSRVSLALGPLLNGRIAPETIVIVGPRLAARRASNGAVSLDLAGNTVPSGVATAKATPLAVLARLIARLTGPEPDSGGTLRLADLRHLAITDATMTVVDQPLGAVWHVPAATVELERSPGRLSGVAAFGLALPHTEARLFASLTFGQTGGQITVSLDPVSPAGLAATVAALAPLHALRAPVSGKVTLDLSPALIGTHVRLSAYVGAGAVQFSGATVKLASGVLVIAGEGKRFAISQGEFKLAAVHDSSPVLNVTGTVTDKAGWHVELEATADGVDFGNLGQFWPAALLHDPRAWIVRNITAGKASDVHLNLSLKSAPGFAHLRVLSIAGGLTGHHLTVRWLPRMPPLTDGNATLVLDGLERLHIDVTSARQGPLTVGPGKIVISGLSAPDQVAEITAAVTGGLAPALALLAEPALHLVQRAPIPLRGAAGSVRAALSFRVPLLARLTLPEVGISAHAELSEVHLSGVLAGRDLDHARLTLNANADGLNLSGAGTYAKLPVQLQAALDFRAHPPGDVASRLTITTDAEASALEKAGLPLGGLVQGKVGLSARLSQRKNGSGEIALGAKLSEARLIFAPLGWVKPVGAAASGSARLIFGGGRTRSIEDIRLTGIGLMVAGRAELAAGGGVDLTFSRLTLGRTVASGTLTLPGNGTPIIADFTGSTLDLSPRLAAYPGPHGPAAHAAKPPLATSPSWRFAARFGRVILGKPIPNGQGRELDHAVISATSDGQRLTSFSLTAVPAGGAPLQLSLAPGPGGRVISATTDNAGALLRAADLTDTLIGGRLNLSARFVDAKPGHPLIGSLHITNFRVAKAPILARLLQAMTFYGLVDVLSGPGLAFDQLSAPFSMTDDVITLGPARAFSPSLGLTAHGTIDRASRQVALRGTIVPAYVFNALLGHLPIVGRIFSPEKGSGLFAADYRVSGSLTNPKVSVYPLSALTPGFLRGIFGLIEQPSGAGKPAAPKTRPAR